MKEVKIKIINLGEVVSFFEKIIKKLFLKCFLYIKKMLLILVYDVIKKKWLSATVFVFIIIVMFVWGLASSLLWLLFLMFLIYQWENRIIAFLALMLLVSCPLLIFFNNSVLAETMALYAYYFLVMTVVLQIVEYNIEQKNERKLKKIWFK